MPHTIICATVTHCPVYSNKLHCNTFYPCKLWTCFMERCGRQDGQRFEELDRSLGSRHQCNCCVPVPPRTHTQAGLDDGSLCGSCNEVDAHTQYMIYHFHRIRYLQWGITITSVQNNNTNVSNNQYKTEMYQDNISIFAVTWHGKSHVSLRLNPITWLASKSQP